MSEDMTRSILSFASQDQDEEKEGIKGDASVYLTHREKNALREQEAKIKRAELENRLLEEMHKDLAEGRGSRVSFGEMIYHFAGLYMLGVFLLLILSGITCNNFRLSDSVLMTLLGTTTANVLGLLVIVITYYFRKLNP